MAGESRIKRALTVNQVLDQNFQLLPFEDQWYQAFRNPEKSGVWFIWGNSGNGKTAFMLQLAKELCRFGRVLYNSLEEGSGHTMAESFKREGMGSVKGKFLLACESIEDLDRRLKRRKSPDFIMIDSYQYTQMSFKEYLAFKSRHPDKLLIFISQADGKKPMGRAAVSVMYDASLKIWVEGLKAFSKGRYIGPNGGTYIIHKEGAAEYHGTQTK